jgi:hypothetical protein
MSSYTLSENFNVQYGTGIDASDPTAVFTNGVGNYEMVFQWYYGQPNISQLYQSYSNLTATEFYDALVYGQTIEEAPSVPLNLDADEVNDKIILTWSSPSSNGNNTITAYKVYRSVGGSSYGLLATLGVVLTYTDSASLHTATNYSYKVSAVNAIGESPVSSAASVIYVGTPDGGGGGVIVDPDPDPDPDPEPEPEPEPDEDDPGLFGDFFDFDFSLPEINFKLIENAAQTMLWGMVVIVVVILVATSVKKDGTSQGWKGMKRTMRKIERVGSRTAKKSGRSGKSKRSGGRKR